MPKESMTPRERWQAVLERRLPDRVPMDYWSTPEVTEKLMAHLGCSSREDMLKRLHVDFVVGVGPRYIGPAIPKGTDVYGIHYRDMSYGEGTYAEVVENPLAQYHSVEQIERCYTWPELDWWDYGDIPNQLKGFEEYPMRGGGSEPFLIYKDLRGHEQALMDLVENPEIVHYCLGKLFDLAYQDTARIFEALPGKVTYSYVAEDLGGQNTLLFSPAHIREYLFPHMRRMITLIHQAGVKVFHHNDGNITKILPELVDLGIDILNPIQWRAMGVDRAGLKQQYGQRLIFHGGVDNQYTLPFGTSAEVRQEVAVNLQVLGRGGGYILAPCHNIQPVTPIENILEMYETGYEMGWR
ncbi:MAG: uroporphyrinogen decarboxylase family protein [Omnitrophica WOR_2 bacterium]